MRHYPIEPLDGYHSELGGSAGDGGTHGEQNVERPPDMPTKDEATHTVSTPKELERAVQVDNAVVWLSQDVEPNEDGEKIIDMTGYQNIWFGDDVTLVGGFCDPNVPGRGTYIKQDYYYRHLFKSAYGKAPTLWGVSLRGPKLNNFDPRERAASSDWNSDDKEDWYASGLWVYDDDTFEVTGCEFWGWSCAGLEVGSSTVQTGCNVYRSSFHSNYMSTLGYGIEHYNGNLDVTWSYFEKNRHGISGFGRKTETIHVKDSLFGPTGINHSLDMHDLGSNITDGGNVAGRYLRADRCTFMLTDGHEGVAIRGKSVKKSWVRKCDFAHPSAPEPAGKQGSPYRQQTNWSEWKNFKPKNNTFGLAQKPGYGAPLFEDQSMILSVTGPDGVSIKYRFTIKGSAKKHDRADKREWVRDNDDGTTTIGGSIYGGVDTFELSDDAIILSASLDGPVEVTLGDDPVDLVGPVSAGASSQHGGGNRGNINELQERISDLEAKLENAHLSFD